MALGCLDLGHPPKMSPVQGASPTGVCAQTVIRKVRRDDRIVALPERPSGADRYGRTAGGVNDRSRGEQPVAGALLQVGRCARWETDQVNAVRGCVVCLFAIPNIEVVHRLSRHVVHIRQALAELGERIEELDR